MLNSARLETSQFYISCKNLCCGVNTTEPEPTFLDSVDKCIDATHINMRTLYYDPNPPLFWIMRVSLFLCVAIGFFMLFNPRIAKHHPNTLCAYELLLVAFYYLSYSS